MPPGPFRPARVLYSPRFGFALTTLALAGLATTGTGLLVAHGTSQLQPPVSHALVPAPLPPALTPVLVDRAPGSLLPTAPRSVRTVRVVTVVAAPRDTTRSGGPSVQLPHVVPPHIPPVVVPPVTPPPVVEPPVTPSLGGGKKKAHPAHPDDKGKHLGQQKHS